MAASSVAESVESLRTMAELVDHLGGIPIERIRMRPIPGTATAEDALEVERKEGRLCEVIDGVLVEKAMGYYESRIAIALGFFIEGFAQQHDLGILIGSDGPMFVEPGQMRYPDLSFFAWKRFPHRKLPRIPILDLVPDLSVEVLSSSNTRREMERKRRENFSAGAQLIWEIEPADRQIRVYTSVDEFTTLGDGDTLEGSDVLPGFRLAVTTHFDRAGQRE